MSESPIRGTVPYGAALLAMLLAGCAGSAVNAPVEPAEVAAIELTLTSLERAALTYTSLPACPTTKVCADPVLKAKIKADDNKAYAAVQALRSNTADPAAMAVAKAALAALIVDLPIQDSP